MENLKSFFYHKNNLHNEVNKLWWWDRTLNIHWPLVRVCFIAVESKNLQSSFTVGSHSLEASIQIWMKLANTFSVVDLFGAPISVQFANSNGSCVLTLPIDSRNGRLFSKVNSLFIDLMVISIFNRSLPAKLCKLIRSRVLKKINLISIFSYQSHVGCTEGRRLRLRGVRRGHFGQRKSLRSRQAGEARDRQGRHPDQ